MHRSVTCTVCELMHQPWKQLTWSGRRNLSPSNTGCASSCPITLCELAEVDEGHVKLTGYASGSGGIALTSVALSLHACSLHERNAHPVMSYCKTLHHFIMHSSVIDWLGSWVTQSRACLSQVDCLDLPCLSCSMGFYHAVLVATQCFSRARAAVGVILYVDSGATTWVQPGCHACAVKKPAVHYDAAVTS